MIRGQQTIFTNLFPASVQPDPSRKGKRNVFKDIRDEALAHRFYYYIHLKRKRYDDTLCFLEREFFLTHEVISGLIEPYAETIKRLVSQETKAGALKRKYPHWTWVS